MLNSENTNTQTVCLPYTGKPNYPFVDWIRFVAMFSIVYEHSLAVPDGKPEMLHFDSFRAMTLAQQEAFLWISQPLKFGTICFFTISGYLLGKQLKPNVNALAYYKKRLTVVGIPFLIAFVLFYLKTIGVFGVFTGKYDKSILSASRLVDQFFTILSSSSYWFIFVFLLSLALMLVCRRYIGLRGTTAVSFLAALFYAVNIYTGWMEPRHTFAFPAFVFYLCLGVWLSKNDQVLTKIRKVPVAWLTGSLLVIFLIAVAESIFLWKLDSIDPRNSLRLSNQLFSIVVFCWLLRINFLRKLPFLNPRTESFGIYLYHLFFVSLIMKVVSFVPALSFLNYHEQYTGWQLAGASILRFLLAYTATLLFVKLLNLTWLRWFFGNSLV